MVALSIVAPLLVVAARSVVGITPSEYHLLNWFGITALTQCHVFVSLSATVTTVLVSAGLGATVLLLYDLVFLFRRTMDEA
ncbi:hypothetical protein NJ7G_0285 [Natrinema sp. J7-2]|nr:hypothetical protein NJ7G_0285 [Natrinema sp. J7-2]